MKLWKVLLEVRHSITHSNSVIEISKLKLSKHHSEIFDYLFDNLNIDEKSIQIKLDYAKFNKLIKTLSEFAFQMFKIISEKKNLEI
jgi:2C-methyl-D-erythritol 2,4-cyclodiphosphate synthase